MRFGRCIAASCAVLVTACPAPQATPDAGGCPAGQRPLGATRACTPVGWSDCPLGFVADDSGVGCVDAVPESCPPGTAALAGELACVPLGPQTCATGFVRDSSGFGCRDVLPPTSCTGATRAALGSTACVPVGDCSAAFPPAGTSVVVDPSAPLDATHVHTLADALARVPDGGVVAVAAGAYAETLSPGHSVSLVGRCPALVTLDGSGSADPVLSLLGAQDSQVSGLTIRNAATALVVAYGAHVSVHDVVVEGSRGEAVSAFWPKTTLSLSRSVIRGTRFTGTNVDGSWGEALQLSDHAEVTVTDTAIEDTDLVGVRARGLGTTVTLTSAVLRDVWRPDGGVAPMGALAEAGGALTIQGSVIAGATQTAVFVAGTDSAATVSDSVLRDSRFTSDLFGYGAYVQEGTLTLRRVTVLDATSIGVVTNTSDAHLVGEDVLIRGTRAWDDGGVGAGLDVAAGVAKLSGLVVLDSVIVGVRVTGAGSSLELDRSLIRGVTGLPDDGVSAGHGLEVNSGAHGTFTRLSIEDGSEGGVSVQDDGSTAALDRVRVTRVEGLGLAVREGSSATVGRSVIAGARNLGVLVYDRASLKLSDSVVRDTRPAVGPGGNPGLGLAALVPGPVLVQRSAVVNNGVIGVLLDGATARLEDVRVAGTRHVEGETAGTGLGLQGGSSVTLDGVVLEDNDEVGLSVAEQSAVTVERSLFATTRAVQGSQGHGLFVFAGGSALVHASTVTANDAIGAGVSGGGLVLSSCEVSNNLVGVHAQGGSSVVERVETPTAVVPNTLVVSSDTTFLGNTSRLGTGLVPLPSTLPLQH